MPFTLAHTAAVLPLRRLRLVPSALVIGSVAPDFEYFVRLAPDEGLGHTPVGIVVLTLPLALVTLWMFHRLVKGPVTGLLSHGLQSRLENYLCEFRFGGAARFVLIVSSILLGIATHSLWDSFTHPTTWLYHRWSLLSHSVRLPIIGVIPYYKAFQHGSTLLGIAILAVWAARWYQTAKPSNHACSSSFSPRRKVTVVAVVTAIALSGAMMRAIAGAGIPVDHASLKKFVGEAVVTAIALLWWELVGYGVLVKLSANKLHRT